MAQWTETALRSQFNRAKAQGWIPIFVAVATDLGFLPEELLAIGSRETNLQNIRGDFRGGIYHGFGIMQVDIGTDPEFSKGGWKDPAKSIRRGGEILASKREELKKMGLFSEVNMYCAYNCGSGNVKKAIAQGKDPNSRTTGKDYGNDVKKRVSVFRKFLAEG